MNWGSAYGVQDFTPDGRPYIRCAGTTKQGNPCKRGALRGSGYCEHHADQCKLDPNGVYVLNTGTAPMRILGQADGIARVEYLLSGFETMYPASRLSIHPDYLEGDTTMNETKLYRVTAEADTYGTFLTNNSAGQMVLEMKGASGAVRAFDPKELEEVMPFTFDIRFGSDDRGYSFLGIAGQLQKDDLLMQDDGQIARVTKVDSKSRRAAKYFSGWKIPAERISTEPAEGS